jgi:phosphate-selective porin OprO and OprP
MHNRFFTLLTSQFFSLLIPLFAIADEDKSDFPYPSKPFIEKTLKNEKDIPRSYSLLDSIDSLGRVYKDYSNPVLQEFWLLGRYHGQYYFTDSSQEQANDYETRRLRLGLQSRIFSNFTVHAQMLSGTDATPFYNGFTELWFQWKPTKAFALTIGQQKHRFTHDRNVSSRYINYLERAMLTNMFRLDYTPAITAQGTIGNATYYTGFFSNATGRNMERSFTEYNSGYSYLGALYYDLDHFWDLDSVTLHTTILHSETKTDRATNLDRFDKGASASLILTKGYASLVTEFVTGIESSKGDAFGINIQPSYFFNEQIQLVGRYQLAISNKRNGLEPQIRYESEVQKEQGDLYQAVYAGLNFYILQNRLKFMQGVEFASMNGHDTWTASSIIRLYFGPHSGGAFPMNKILPLDYD